MRILLADDLDSARAAMRLVLEAAGHEVVCVEDGAAAIAHSTDDSLDMAVLDIWMPRLSGLEVLKALRNRPRPLPVVLISGGGPGASLEQATALADLHGAAAVLYKPAGDEELLAAVNAAAAAAAAAAATA